MVSIDNLLCRFCIGCSLSLNNTGTKLCVIGDIFGPSYSFDWYGGDQNLGFNSFVYLYCSYVGKLGSMLTSNS
jgi:hypothetical protein